MLTIQQHTLENKHIGDSFYTNKYTRARAREKVSFGEVQYCVCALTSQQVNGKLPAINYTCHLSGTSHLFSEDWSGSACSIVYLLHDADCHTQSWGSRTNLQSRCP